MNLKNITQLRLYIEKHKNYPCPFDGYVPIGFGDELNWLLCRYGIPSIHLYTSSPSYMLNGKIGSIPDYMYYVTNAFYEAHVKERNLTMVEQVEKAQGLIGKKVMSSRNKVFTPLHIRVINPLCIPFWLTGDDEKIVKEKGFLVIVENECDYTNVETAEEYIKPTTVTLNSTYEAVIEGDNVKVGCQTIPIEKVKEIIELYNDLNK